MYNIIHSALNDYLYYDIIYMPFSQTIFSTNSGFTNIFPYSIISAYHPVIFSNYEKKCNKQLIQEL